MSRIPTTTVEDSQVKVHKPSQSNKPPKKPNKKKKKQINPNKIYTRFVRGFYQNIRLVTMYGVLLLFVTLPFLRWEGRQALWLDIGTQHFYIFGLTFMPQDMYFLAAMFIIAAFTLFMVTVFAGRVFCGYSCPQTIWTHMFMKVEQFFEGDRNKRIRLDREPISLSKFGKRFGKHVVWLLLAFFTAATFVSYVVSTDFLYHSWHQISLFGLSIPFPDWSGKTWLFIFIFTFATYMNAGWMRENMCIHICPYGRFQSVMFDRDTLIISYDKERGEPRGARKKNTEENQLGDCVNCLLCVQVCPTGIDIRDGLQMACIQCAACVDACNSIMDKMNYPRGLVRYTTERQLVEHEQSHFVRPKLLAYIALLSLIISGFTYMLVSRVPVELDSIRDRNQLAVVRGSNIENAYTLKITNKTQQSHTYTVSLESPDPSLRLETRWKEVPLEPGESFDVPVSVIAAADAVKSDRTPITFVCTSMDKDSFVGKSKSVFTLN